MAEIDRGDAIRRPSDSTLTARTLRRGQESVLQAQPQVLDQLRQSSPVIAVVVERKNLGSDRKPLFDLLLSVNNQVVQARSERPLPPGTVLSIEVTANNTLKVLPNPEPGQLNRMMQASLNFWQAHTLPRVHATQLPDLPDASARQLLANDYPALRPLLNWLNQAPQLSGATVARWVQEFLPLNTQPATLTQAAPGTHPNRRSTDPQPAPPIGNRTGIATPSPAPDFALRTLVAALQAGSPGILALAAKPNAVSAPANTPATLGPNPATLINQPPGNAAGGSPALPTPSMTPITSTVNSSGPGARLPGQELPASALGALLKTEPAPASVTLNVGSVTTQAIKPEWSPLPQPGNESGRVPIEIRLGQWLGLIEERIHQHPSSLQQSLTQRAQQLLNTGAGDYARQASAAPQRQGGSPAEELQPLLQLRNWAEAVQGKTQNNAIQQALATLAQGDQPNVQQLSIPLIWLGPSAWVNLEWWQEKERKKEKEDDSRGKRLWRFRLFFELAPLAPLCADLVWEPDNTHLTFWSQDQNTLAFLNENLDTLEQWTEGLGEREVVTRHGMPRKKSTPDPEQFKPLVDIRT